MEHYDKSSDRAIYAYDPSFFSFEWPTIGEAMKSSGFYLHLFRQAGCARGERSSSGGTLDVRLPLAVQVSSTAIRRMPEVDETQI